MSGRGHFSESNLYGFKTEKKIMHSILKEKQLKKARKLT